MLRKNEVFFSVEVSAALTLDESLVRHGVVIGGGRISGKLG
jgi:hypothetical protein